MTETAVSSVDNLIWIAVVAVALSLLLRSRGIGTALPLLGCGIVIGLLPIGPTAPAAPEAIQALVLAPLVFGEALSSSYIDIKKVRRPVLALAILLVAATTLIVGGVVAALLVSIPAAMALALGAILAPTDAVAVANAARRANLPAKIVSVLEGESLVNDATGLTALRVAVVAAVAGSITIAEAGAVLAQSVAVGLAIGVVSGWVLVLMLRHSSDVVGFGGLLLIAPFPIYMLTEELGGSAILAIVTAALMASHASHSDPSYRGRLAVATVWRQITFILQSIAFLLLGIELPFAIGELPQAQVRLLPLTVLAVTLVLIVTRMGFVFGMFGVDRWVSTNPTGDWRSAAIVGWAGARGPVSALAAFSLPFVAESGAPIPYRDFVVATALCVIMVTLMISPRTARARVGGRCCRYTFVASLGAIGAGAGRVGCIGVGRNRCRSGRRAVVCRDRAHPAPSDGATTPPGRRQHRGCDPSPTTGRSGSGDGRGGAAGTHPAAHGSRLARRCGAPPHDRYRPANCRASSRQKGPRYGLVRPIPVARAELIMLFPANVSAISIRMGLL